MENQTAVDRLRAIFRKSVDDQEYEPLAGAEDDVRRPVLVVPDAAPRFSYAEYSVFLLLGIAMLWAWYAALLELGRGTNTNDMQEHVSRRSSLLSKPF